MTRFYVLIFFCSSIAFAGERAESLNPGIKATLIPGAFIEEIDYEEALEEFFRFTLVLENESAREWYVLSRPLNYPRSFRIRPHGATRRMSMDLSIYAPAGPPPSRLLKAGERAEIKISLLWMYPFELAGRNWEQSLARAGRYDIAATIEAYPKPPEFEEEPPALRIVTPTVEFRVPHPSDDVMSGWSGVVRDRGNEDGIRLRTMRLAVHSCPHHALDLCLEIAMDPEEPASLREQAMIGLSWIPNLVDYVDPDTLEPLLREGLDDGVPPEVRRQLRAALAAPAKNDAPDAMP